MTSALERKIVSGVGVMYPGSDLESATTPALALLDAEWPDPFLDRIGETISVRVSSTTGYYEFTDESGSVFWIEIPVAPLTWNWVAPFLRPYDPPTQDFSLIAPWHLADRWRLSTEALEELRAVPPLLRSLPPRSAPETSDVTNLLLEMGTGFAFMGRQKEIIVGGRSRKIDLLFYHVRLRCYIACEIKVKPFEPEFTGKLNYYVSAVDELVKAPDDNPTIGLLICSDMDKTDVQWSFRGITTPMGVAITTISVSKICYLPKSN